MTDQGLEKGKTIYIYKKEEIIGHVEYYSCKVRSSDVKT